jgi:hypothetical protein
MGNASRRRKAEAAAKAEASREKSDQDDLQGLGVSGSAATRNPAIKTPVAASRQELDLDDTAVPGDDETKIPPLRPAPTSGTIGPAQGPLHQATTAGGIVAFFTGDAKILASKLLLFSLFLVVVCCLWMLIRENEFNRLTWPEGYKHFAQKSLAATCVVGGAVTLALIGYSVFCIFSLIKRSVKRWFGLEV